MQNLVTLEAHQVMLQREVDQIVRDLDECQRMQQRYAAPIDDLRAATAATGAAARRSKHGPRPAAPAAPYLSPTCHFLQSALLEKQALLRRVAEQLGTLRAAVGTSTAVAQDLRALGASASPAHGTSLLLSSPAAHPRSAAHTQSSFASISPQRAASSASVTGQQPLIGFEPPLAMGPAGSWKTYLTDDTQAGNRTLDNTAGRYVPHTSTSHRGIPGDRNIVVTMPPSGVSPLGAHTISVNVSPPRTI